jgi:hypothetical protein
VSTAAPTIARVHPAVLVEVGVEHPRRQRLTELDRKGSSAGAHDHARDPLRMCRRREQSGRCSHVRPDDVRPAQISLNNQPGQELAHRSWREKVLSAFGCAEPRQVNGEQAGVLGERGPDRRECVQAFRPGAGKQQRRLPRATAIGVPDLQSVDRSELRLD